MNIKSVLIFGNIENIFQFLNQVDHHNMVIPGLARIISKLNCNRLLTDCVNRNLLSVRNCAFQKNNSTHDITIDMTENLLQCFQNGPFGETSFEDLKSAYDSVWIKGLLYKLVHEYGMDEILLHSLIHNLQID